MMIFPSVHTSIPEAVSAAQQMINIIAGASVLQVDGKPGPRTAKAFEELNSDNKRLVSALLAARGATPSHLRPITLISRPIQKLTDISINVVKTIIREQARASKVNPALALTIARMESGFDQKARSPSGAAGVFQLTKIAIVDTAKHRRPPSFGFSGDKLVNHVKQELLPNVVYGVNYLVRSAQLASMVTGKNIDASSASMEDWVYIYAAFNIGHVSLRTIVKMEKGLATKSEIAKANAQLSHQASRLRQGGLASYLDNVKQFIQDNLTS